MFLFEFIGSNVQVFHYFPLVKIMQKLGVFYAFLNQKKTYDNEYQTHKQNRPDKFKNLSGLKFCKINTLNDVFYLFTEEGEKPKCFLKTLLK